MTDREITTLMHRLFWSSSVGSDPFVHLMVNDALDESRVHSLLDRYIQGDELLMFVNSQHCAFSSRRDAFANLKSLLQHGTVRIADPRFRGRVIIEPLGVGTGSAV
jgi:hypothetical protein